MPGSVREIILQKANKIWKSLVRSWFAIFIVHNVLTKRRKKHVRAKNLKGSDVITSKRTQMYLFIKEPVCDTVDKTRHFKTRAAAKGLARVIGCIYTDSEYKKGHNDTQKSALYISL